MPPVSAVGTLPLAARRTQPAGPDGRFRRSPSHVPCKSRRPGSRRLYAGHHLARTRDTRQAHPEGRSRTPGFDATFDFRRLNDDVRSEHQPGPDASGTSSWSPPDPIKPSLFPGRSPRRSSANAAPGWFDACPRGPTPEGQQASISRTAPLSGVIAYMTTPSAFVTHAPRHFQPTTTVKYPPGLHPFGPFRVLGFHTVICTLSPLAKT